MDKDSFNEFGPERDLAVEESRLTYWFPVAEGLGIPSPKTRIVPLNRDEIRLLQSDELPLSLVPKVRKAAEGLGVPFFLRTDLSSGKHEWDKTCFVSDPRELDNHIVFVAVANNCADMLGLPYKSLVVREYIPLDSSFTAFLGNLPISRERRIFTRDGKIECIHAYWVEGAVREGVAAPEEDWLPKLRALNTDTAADLPAIQQIKLWAGHLSKKLKGYWSVDFARTKDGRWILIDAGRGEISYHATHNRLYEANLAKGIRYDRAISSRHDGSHEDNEAGDDPLPEGRS